MPQGEGKYVFLKDEAGQLVL